MAKSMVRVAADWFTSGSGSVPEAVRLSGVTFPHVSLRAAAGGDAASCAVNT
jgi:hypothetical protein